MLGEDARRAGDGVARTRRLLCLCFHLFENLQLQFCFLFLSEKIKGSGSQVVKLIIFISQFLSLVGKLENLSRTGLIETDFHQSKIGTEMPRIQFQSFLEEFSGLLGVVVIAQIISA